MADLDEAGDEDTSYPLTVEYCGICTMPPEVRTLSSLESSLYCIQSQYCEYGPDPSKCYEWMKANLPDYYSRIEENSMYPWYSVTFVN